MSNETDEIKRKLISEIEAEEGKARQELQAVSDMAKSEAATIENQVRADLDGLASDVSKGIDGIYDSSMSAPSTPAETGKKPAETISSQGYDATKKPQESGTDKKSNGVDSPTDGVRDHGHDNGVPNQGGTREQAPDVDKEYGSGGSLEDDQVPQEPVGDGEVPTDEKKGKDDPKEDKVSKKEKEDPEGEADPKKKDPKKKEGEEDQEDDPKKKGDPTKKQPGEEPQGNKNGNPNQLGQNGVGQQGAKQPGQGQNQPNQGNGLGKKPNGGGTGQNSPNGVNHSDPTSRARRNLSINNNRQNSSSSKPAAKSGGKTGSTGSKGKGKSDGGIGGGIKSALGKVGNGLKNTAKKLTRSDKPKGKSGSGSESFLGGLKNAAVTMFKRHPILTSAAAIIILIIFIVIMDDIEAGSGGRGRGKRACTYELTGVTSTGTVELSNLKVEVINCDGTADNYEVLDTVDFEKYILGVALAEAGPSSPDEAIKAQIIAVRNFTLTRNSGMCPGNPSDCFYGYNESTGIIRMRACTNDQVYWDYTKDCPKIERSGQPTLYCEGVDGSTDIWKRALSEERQDEVEAIANSVMGEVLLDENGNVLKLGYQKDETDQFIADANAGKSYVEILESVYGANDYSSAKCSYGGVYDYGDYTLSSQDTTILHEPLGEFLEDNGSSLEEFNELIADNVDDAGWGTRAGVVAAAVTLIGELGDNYGVKVPYYWGGGHYDGVVDGALAKWGSTECHTYANDQHYNYCGFDCSGFVPWAIKNGGFKKSQDLAGNFKNMPNARKVTLTNKPELQPGDLLESEGHIVLVVGIDEASGQYICAEAMGNAYGVLFSRRAFNESGYWGVDLEGYYNDPNYIREPIR